MSLNSVNTNIGAMVALQTLNRTNEALAVSQKRVSTGFRVADAKDDGAVFAIAQAIRGDVAALTSVNEQLGGTKGLLETTMSSLRNISDTMNKMKEVLVKLADGNVTGPTRTQYENQYTELRNNVEGFINDAGYNGKSLLKGNGTFTSQYVAQLKVIRNQLGSLYTITGCSAANFIFNTMGAAPTTRTAACTALALTNSKFNTAFKRVAQQLNAFGSNFRYIENQIRFNKDKIDAIESGLGALIDADLAKESARLQALQIRQQLGTQSLGIANQSPQILLSLFR
jgi:flagellin